MLNTYSMLIKKLFFHESWDIMIIKNNSHLFPENTLDILNNSKAQLLRKKYTFQADPFIIEKEDKLYVFYEAFSFLNSRGMLKCRVLDSNLGEVEDIKLEGFDGLKCHLSFPFLFYHEGELFMIPESSERKEVMLFRCTEFPGRWEMIKVLISDAEFTDNIYFTSGDKSYLISTTMKNEMVIHTACSLFGKWEKITPTLKLSNYHHRGAGKPYFVNNKNYILTQECHPDCYGKSIYIKELIGISPLNFEEKLVANISPLINQSAGVHTLNFTDSYIVYDTKNLIFSLLSPLKKISYKFQVKFRKQFFA
ncbi:glucosamine inositolphosphorylceramide transferase family protein [Buttiauxella agrestis]|uniref:Glucosamine inositolphosphorylceramide transferase 1 N-terminal domain-containing protein n=1 Tax=Buttiauxella agrestis ATCC 33320 TaxID=1006004 RepID=A0A085GD29_9ENTR|nr:hypothetical protein GBAG_2409 [Buttiauxella agrestis ATCC 33320]